MGRIGRELKERDGKERKGVKSGKDLKEVKISDRKGHK